MKERQGERGEGKREREGKNKNTFLKAWFIATCIVK